MSSLVFRSKKLKAIQAVLLVVVMLSWPFSASAIVPASAYGSEANRFQKELNLLVPVFSIDVGSLDTVNALEKAIDGGAFQGLKSWSYEGVRDGDKITLNWKVEWFDEHAVLAAYKNPALKKKLTEKQAALLKKCESVIGTVITRQMTDYEKQLAIHDYIALHCAYDEALEKSANITGGEDSFYAYGALINGKAVCSGYSEAAKLLMDMIGIESYLMVSKEHSWNLVKIGGEYYHMDISWDDPAPDIPGLVLYDYFNLPDAMVSGYDSHGWLNKGDYPKANALKHNYFVHNNLAADNYVDLQRLLRNAAAAGNKQITILVSGSLTSNFDWNQQLKFINGLPFGNSIVKKYSYSPPNKNKSTLTVVFNS